MYGLILGQGYNNMPFKFKDEDRLKDFMFEALEHSVPDEQGNKLEARIEKCAEGGNPEPAHNENQE